MGLRSVIGCVLVAISLLGLSPGAMGVQVRHDVGVQHYNALGSTEQANAIGQLVAQRHACSAALVSPTQVLTAGHCVQDSNGDLLAGSQMVFRLYINGRFTRVVRGASVDVHPGWGGRTNIDVAILNLEEAITDIEPLVIASADPTGRLATVIGFGAQGTGADPNFNLRRAGAFARLGAHNYIDAIQPYCCHPSNLKLSLDFDNPTNPALNRMGSPVPHPLEGSPCFGDSGSPLLARFGDRDFVVGVASVIRAMGSSGLCGYGEVAGYQWVGNDVVASWLELHGIPVVDDPYSWSPEDQPAAGSDGPGQSGAPEVATDINRDNMMSIHDVAAFLDGAHLGDPASDLNNDGRLDERDAALILDALGIRTEDHRRRKHWNRAMKRLWKTQLRHLVGTRTKHERREDRRLLARVYTL